MPVLQPQPGPQERFLATEADVCIYGGSAGGGKTCALLLEAIRNYDNPDFNAVIFRRTTPQITNPGALWDESAKFFALLGARPIESKLKWVFPSGMSVKLAHMELAKDRLAWQGSQIPFIAFDELTHFEEIQFFYMLSRNRSLCGVRPYLRATCNPDSGSWVRGFISWWIDPQTGLAITDRCGEIRWMYRYRESIRWFDTQEEAIADIKKNNLPEEMLPKSVTFIAASVHDNKILMENDPGYLANLYALPLIEREQLLGGNWNISANHGILKNEWLRYYKTAALPYVESHSWSVDTAVKEGQDNDFSVAQYWAKCANGYYLVKQWRGKVPYPELKAQMQILYAAYPAREVLIEDKQSGQQLIQDFKRDSTMPVIPMMPGKNMALKKIERMNYVSTLFEAGKVYIPEDADFTEDLKLEWLSFPNGEHDDQCDAMTQYLSRRLLDERDMSVGGAVTTGGNIASIAGDLPPPLAEGKAQAAPDPDQNPYAAFGI